MPKKIWLMPLSISILLWTGCSDDAVTKTENDKRLTTAITVTENAVKVAKETKTDKENSGQFYYSYNKEKNGSNYNSENSKNRTEIDAYREIRSPYERVQITLMIKQLSPDYRLLCSACHDDYANGIIGPSLLDKNSTQIYNSIVAFKTGAKKNPLMKQLVNKIGEPRLRSIATEIEIFNKQIKKMRSKR